MTFRTSFLCGSLKNSKIGARRGIRTHTWSLENSSATVNTSLADLAIREGHAPSLSDLTDPLFGYLRYRTRKWMRFFDLHKGEIRQRDSCCCYIKSHQWNGRGEDIRNLFWGFKVLSCTLRASSKMDPARIALAITRCKRVVFLLALRTQRWYPITDSNCFSSSENRFSYL